VVQKYLENPLLVHGRKFDIRAYALVTPHGNVYLHRESYVRTSSMPFCLVDLDNRLELHVSAAFHCEIVNLQPSDGRYLGPQNTHPQSNKQWH
jgi:Tubulin-tyrosine ligase family